MLCAGEAEWECGSAVGRASMEIHGCLDYRAEHAHPKPLCLYCCSDFLRLLVSLSNSHLQDGKIINLHANFHLNIILQCCQTSPTGVGKSSSYITTVQYELLIIVLRSSIK